MAADEPDVSPFSGLLGLEWLKQEPDDTQARLTVRKELTQPYGYLHGGVFSAVADELCSRSTVIQVIMDGRVALGQTVEMSLLRSVREGSVIFKGRARHRGTTSWVWDVEAIDERDRLCALGRVTVAVRKFEPPR